jgi:hypothetical protein
VFLLLSWDEMLPCLSRLMIRTLTCVFYWCCCWLFFRCLLAVIVFCG